MKILVLGDIHGRIIWLDIIKKENPNKIIFLGDYVSTHEDITAEQQCINLEDILNYKEENSDKVILLRGNHDMQHLGYSWAECSGYDKTVEEYMVSIKSRFLKLTKWLHIEGNIVFSHAGVSKTWFNNMQKVDKFIKTLEDINNIDPCEQFGFWPCKLSDYCGDSVTQPLTWIRPYTLIANAYGDYSYVVGHTAISYYKPEVVLLNDEIIKGYKGSYLFDENNEQCKANLEFYKNTNKIWCCDALPYEYLIIDNNEFIVRKNDLE